MFGRTITYLRLPRKKYDKLWECLYQFDKFEKYKKLIPMFLIYASFIPESGCFWSIPKYAWVDIKKLLILSDL